MCLKNKSFVVFLFDKFFPLLYNDFMMKSRSFYASIISTVVFAAYFVFLIISIVEAWASFAQSSWDDTRKAVEGSLYIVLLFVVCVSLTLSIISLVWTIKKHPIFFGQARKITFSNVFFDFFMAFLFFILCFADVGIVGIVLYAIGLICLAIAGGLCLIDYNIDLKFQKANRNKINNTAIHDTLHDVEEIVDKEEKKEEDK